MAIHRALWALVFAIATQISDALVMEFGEHDGARSMLFTPLCLVPVLASTAEQMHTPSYQFSLEKGGTIDGTVEVAAVQDVQGRLPLLGVGEPVEEMKRILNTSRKTGLQIRRSSRYVKSNHDHHNWIQLIQNIRKWVSDWGRGVSDDAKGEEASPAMAESQPLDNVYLMILSKPQWDLYLSSHPDDQVEPSEVVDKFVFSSHFAAEMRIPITEVGQPVTFKFKAKTTDRFFALLFNADERKLVLRGKVRFVNPGNDHLPVEMKHFRAVIVFWEIVFVTSGALSVMYLALFHARKAVLSSYLVAFNFTFVSLYLRLDRQLLDSIRATGTYSNILWTVAHLVKRLHENCLLAVMVLLALGWKVHREHLTGIEFRMVFSVAAASTVVGFIEVLFNGVDVSRYLVNTLAFIVMLMASNFNTLVIRTRVVDESLSPQTGIFYSYLKVYKIFKVSFFAYIFKPAIYSTVRTMCLQSSAEQNFIWDEHFMLFMDLLFDYVVYCLYFLAFMPISQLPLFKHLLATHSRLE
ncbi:cleavage and polyadenylation specificty factor subunit [Babesia caballi]|uniref:Cleavage and polyadenylation specificty factor subunit n=1 Tax=Babesia caballi TaxID=5871 RepID=A0AAV4M1D7_BABCB|nr:cleavage and polyadenylation specificty factor subunit [Babesia caballi]